MWLFFVFISSNTQALVFEPIYGHYVLISIGLIIVFICEALVPLPNIMLARIACFCIFLSLAFICFVSQPSYLVIT